MWGWSGRRGELIAGGGDSQCEKIVVCVCVEGGGRLWLLLLLLALKYVVWHAQGRHTRMRGWFGRRGESRCCINDRAGTPTSWPQIQHGCTCRQHFGGRVCLC